MTLNISTGGKPSNAEIVARDNNRREKEVQNRLSRLTPQQRKLERLERLLFIALRAKYAANYPPKS